MKICPSCSTENNDKAKFCSKCGKELTVKSTCPYCKKVIKPKDTFCNNCGKNLIWEAQKSKKKKLTKLQKVLIAVGSFIGLVAILFLSFFLYIKFYFIENYTIFYQQDGTIDAVTKKDIPDLSFGKLAICENVDSNNSPINPKSEFDIGTREIYASIPVSGANSTDNFKFIWKYANTGKTIVDFSSDYNTIGPYFKGYERSYLKLPDNENINNYKVFSEPGEYIVEYYHNDKLIDSAAFKIIAKEPVFEGQVVGEKIDSKTLSPVETKDNYEYNTKELYSAIHILGLVNPKDNFRFCLKDVKSDAVIKEFSGSYSDLTQKKYLDQYIYFYLTGPYSDKPITINPGDYTVEVYHNGQLVSSAQFNISAPEIKFGKLITSKTKDIDQPPVDPTVQFILGNRRICASIQVEGATKDDKWKFVWATGDKKTVFKEFEDTYNVKDGEYFNGYEYLNIYVPEDQTVEGTNIFGYPGQYLVEFYHNNELIDSKVFEVVDSGVRFGELAMCEKVDSDDKPIKATNEFKYGTKLICATIEIKGSNLSDGCKFVWKSAEDNKVLREMDFRYSDNWKKGGSKYSGYFAVALSLTEGQNLEDHDILGSPGPYIVEFYHDGYLISTASFTIIE